jgi:alpha-tubulin suppressor-like RCC1 family protein
MKRTRVAAILCGLTVLFSCDRNPTPPALEPLQFEAVATGSSHTCALAAGEAYCWGRGGLGALGIDTLRSATVPTHVTTGGFRYQTLGAYDDRTCAVTAASELYCWGAGEHGELGNGQNLDRPTPTLVPGRLAFSSVAPGGDHTCALTTTNDVFCWGMGDHGQLGNGSLANLSLPGARAGTTDKYRTVSAGASHTCALTTEGVVSCWGVNNDGQLGNATTVTLSLPQPIASDLRFTAVSTGFRHTCAVSTGRTIYCWGLGSNGQLGNGTLTTRLSATAVSSDLSFVSVAAGGQHTCALTDDGRAFCWGSNSDGQLGTGTAGAVQPVPAAVVSTVRFKQLSAGEFHTCGVTTTTQIHCWGYGGFGQLGTGTTLNQSAPTRVAR